jgi:amidase
MEWAHAEADVIASVRQAARTFAGLGAECSEVSFPLLRYAVPAHRTLIVVEAAALYDAPDGYFRLGPYSEQWAATFEHLFRAHPNLLPFTMKSKVASGNYLRREHYVRYYAKAQNVRRAMETELNALFDRYDVLLMPTVPFKAPAFTDLDGGGRLVNEMLLRVVSNLCVFNLLGHPALTVPCGRGENNLPIGLQLAGRHFADGVLFQAGHAFETTFNLY